MKRDRDLLQNNNFVRLISLVMGIALWVIVNSAPGGQSNGLATITQTLRNVQVTVVAPSDMVVVSEQPQSVNLSVSGSIIDVATVQAEASQIRVVANALTLGPGIHQVPVIMEHVPSSSVNYVPDTGFVTVDLQPKIGQSLKPKLTIVGQPATGLSLGQPIVSVSHVVVSGPNTLVHQVVAVTARVNVSGAQTNFTRIIPVFPVSADGRVIPGVVCNPSTVTVTIPIENPVHAVKLVATTAGTPSGNVVVSGISINPSQVQVQGTSSDVDALTSIALPPISVDHLTQTQTIQVAIPIPFVGAHLSTPTVNVTVTIAPKATVTLQGIPISLVGNAQGTAYTLEGQKTTSITITGPADIVTSLTAADIEAYVDVSQVANGMKKSLPIQISLPMYTQTASIVPATVTVAAVKSSG
ncbi:MAG: CdaR family protein [Acidibacillus sp.]|nr:CdaR family protein [Acidibacillus sp.]